MSPAWPPPPPEVVTQPGCYRHPKLPAPVNCTRCSRPICTSCMVSAPVGWQCPECLKDAPAVRHMGDVQRGAFGLTAERPYVTLTLIALCVAAYVGQQVADITTRGQIVASAVARGEVWRVATSGFLHAGLIHLLFNMLILYQLGSVLESRVGKARFLGLYCLSLVGGSIGVMLLQAPTRPAVGASGAVFGLMGAVVVQARRGRSPIESSVGGLLVLNLVITFVLPGIAIGGHLGGLVAGLVGGLLVRVVGERADFRRVAATTAVLLALTAGLVVAARPVAEARYCGTFLTSAQRSEMIRLGRQDVVAAYDSLGRTC